MNIVSQISLDKRPRSGKPWVGIIIHHTGLPDQLPSDLSAWQKFSSSVVNWLTKKDEHYLSAHYMINREGQIYMLVDPRTHIAYHAGVSSYYHPRERKWLKNWNEYAIGIELLGDGNRIEYSEEQYQSLAYLCRELHAEFPTIDPRCITGHENIAPDRKQDPGQKFNWNYLFNLIYQGG